MKNGEVLKIIFEKSVGYKKWKCASNTVNNAIFLHGTPCRMADTYQRFVITSDSALLRNFGVYLSNYTQAHPRVKHYSVTIMNEERNPYQLMLILTLTLWRRNFLLNFSTPCI